MKKNYSAYRRCGVTLIEVLVVVAILGILMIATLVIIGPGPLMKARDARRKSDLARMKRTLEDYFNDNERYPALPGVVCRQDFGKYGALPCDPKNNSKYKYSYTTNASGQWYKLYATLENEQDKVISGVGCLSDGCRGGDGNWGVSSPNVGLTGCEDGETFYGCAPGLPPACNNINPSQFSGPYKCGPIGCLGLGCCPNSCQ